MTVFKFYTLSIYSYNSAKNLNIVKKLMNSERCCIHILNLMTSILTVETKLTKLNYTCTAERRFVDRVGDNKLCGFGVLLLHNILMV